MAASLTSDRQRRAVRAAQDILAAWKAGRTVTTLEAYQRVLDSFAAWWERRAPAAAAISFVRLPVAEAHQLVLGYLRHLEERKLAAASIRLHLAALKSLVQVSRMIGLATWKLEIAGPKVTPLRDTRGPGRAGFLRLVGAAEDQAEPKRSRDLAILWLLYGRGLRRAEVAQLHIEHLDLAGERIQILGKHRRELEWVTIPPATIRALFAWLDQRGRESGPLFSRLDRAAKRGYDQPLSGRSMARLIASLGQLSGTMARPHGLRHAAITEVLDLTGGNVRIAQQFGRFRSATMLQYYDDNREDLGGNAANLIAP